MTSLPPNVATALDALERACSHPDQDRLVDGGERHPAHHQKTIAIATAHAVIAAELNQHRANKDTAIELMLQSHAQVHTLRAELAAKEQVLEWKEREVIRCARKMEQVLALHAALHPVLNFAREIAPEVSGGVPLSTRPRAVLTVGHLRQLDFAVNDCLKED